MNHSLTTRSVHAFRLTVTGVLTLTSILLAFRGRDGWESLTYVESGVLAIFIIYWLTGKLEGWAERRFSGETQHPERILSELGHAIAGVRDIRALVDIVVPRLTAALHAEPITVLVDSDHHYELCCGTRQTRDLVVFDKRSAVVRHLQRLQSPAKIDSADAQSWIYGVPEIERNAVTQLEARVLVPMSVDRRIVGILSLGQKRWDMPYSRADLQFLTAAASQTGLALENARLNEDIRAEIAARERLNRELEIARDVQQGLFPQTLPKVDRLDFAGYCRPASGVGGDYYDFIAVHNHSLGIAIGDVSGKGIGAALMMATLQASLRGQTIKPCETLAETMQNVNRLVYEASSSSRYATFFYAEYDPALHALRYVNAGHNAPMLCRNHNDGR
jgi:sigma-B regulation protein RsbU (phosphoserine phosphatase)